MVNYALAWARRNLAWSNTRTAWRERLGPGLALAGTGALGWYTGNLTLAQQVFFWSLWLFLLAVLLRRGWFTLCGPILLYDLVRITRRSRYTLYRFYAYFVIVLLGLFFASWYWQQREVRSLSLKETASFAAVFFYFFLGLQL